MKLDSIHMAFDNIWSSGRWLYGYSAVPFENEKMEIEITLNNDPETGYDFGNLDTCSANLYVTLKLNDIQYYNNESLINPLIDINKINGIVNTDITSSLCEKITFIDNKLANTFYMSDIYPNFAVEISDVLLPNGLSYSLTNKTNFDQNNFIYGLNVLGNVSNACSGIASGNLIAYNTIDGNKIQITNPAPFSFEYEFLGVTIDYSKYMGFSGLCFEAINDKNIITFTAINSDPAALTFYYSNDAIETLATNGESVDLWNTSYQLTHKYDRVAGFNDNQNNAGSLIFEISAFSPFNLFGSFNFSTESSSVINKELFTNNIYLNNIYYLYMYQSLPRVENNYNITEYNNTIYESCFSGCTSLKFVNINFSGDFVNIITETEQIITHSFNNFFAGCTSLNHLILTGYNIFGQSHITTTNWLTPDNLPNNGTFECTTEMWNSLSSSLASIFEAKGWTVKIQ